MSISSLPPMSIHDPIVTCTTMLTTMSTPSVLFLASTGLNISHLKSDIILQFQALGHILLMASSISMTYCTLPSLHLWINPNTTWKNIVSKNRNLRYQLCCECHDTTCLLRLPISCRVVTCHEMSGHVANVATYKAFVSRKIGDIYVSQ